VSSCVISCGCFFLSAFVVLLGRRIVCSCACICACVSCCGLRMRILFVCVVLLTSFVFYII